MMNRWLLTTLFVIGSSLAETRVPFNVRVTKNSATIYKINLNEESNQPTLAEASNVKLFFHEEAGTPEWSSDCPEKSHCLRWMKNGKTNGEMIIYPFSSVPTNPDNRWQVTTNGPPHTYVIDYDGYYLYGGPLDYIYPSNADVKINAPSVTSEGGVIGVDKARNVVERVWMSTNGHAVRVSEDTPLFFSQNATTLLLTVKSELPYPTDQVNVNSLLTLCLKANVKDAWQCIHQNHYRATPGLEVIRYPTLTTWVTYKSNISQQTVLDFVKTADSHNILASVIGIDDGWETCYGSQIFNNKFPDPKQMVTDLGKMGREVTLWVHPFVNVECEAYDRLKDYLLKYDNGSIVNTTWWNGRGAMINFLDDKATDFYYNRLKKLQTDYGVQGFKFDAGEISYIAELNEALALDLPNKYTQNYVAMAAKFGAIGEVRVGAGTSQEKIRMRLQDTNSVWEQEKGGLKSVIPSMLQLAVIGYDATIPDMVGGNEYGTTVDKEMFIRWLQMSILMPFYQFSIPPWNYDNETVSLTRDLMELHSNYSIYMYRIMLDAKDIRPIVTPMWWIEPNDKAAQACNDQFLLGDDILVAPVVEKGATSRDIYFPSGYWYDLSANRGYFGPKIEKDFAAPLNKLPWFQRISPYAFFEDRANVKLVP